MHRPHPRNLDRLDAGDDARLLAIVAFVVDVLARQRDLVEVVAGGQLEEAVAVQLGSQHRLVAAGHAGADLDQAGAVLVDLDLHVHRGAAQLERLDHLGRVGGQLPEGLFQVLTLIDW